MYHETMLEMFKKINSREIVVGWYTTGVRYKAHDLEINELVRRYCDDPVLVLIDVNNSDEMTLPTQGFVSLEEVSSEGAIVKTFKHVPCSVEAFEAEEVGVEHLMRDVQSLPLDSIDEGINQKILSLKGLSSKLEKILGYLNRVEDGTAPINNQIIYNLQEILNLMPSISDEEKMRAFNSKTNDNYFSIYICSIVQSVTTLHSLINNKLTLRRQEVKRINEKKNPEEKKEEKVIEAQDDKK